MQRQTGASVISFLFAFAIAGGALAITVALSSSLLRQGALREDFSSAMTDVFTYTEHAISAQWEASGCRAQLTSPTVSQLVNDYDAPRYLLTTPYAIAIDLQTSPGSTFSVGIKVTVSLPQGMTGYSLKTPAMRVAQDVFITGRRLTLYRSMATIQSQLQLQYFDGENGCMQQDFL